MRMTGAAWVRLGSLALTVIAVPAAASPYCAEVQGMRSQCIYVDANECRVQAQKLGGSCAVNPAEVTLPTVGQFPYCISGAGYSTCKFADRGTCEAEASRVRATCVESFATGPQSAPPDPYRDQFVTGR